VIDGSTPPGARVWSVAGLSRAVADAVAARFSPVAVRGEITAFSRAASGHCYFTLRDADGGDAQLRSALFRGAAQRLSFSPRDGQRVVVRGRMAIYEPRGDLQVVAESMALDGEGAWLERFVLLKTRLAAAGLFDADRKRPVAAVPRVLGVVCSAQAAAWHDVATTLQRRAPHVQVVLAPSLVQGAQAPAQLVAALRQLAALADPARAAQAGLSGPVQTVLLVRGGGSLEDLWAFNDEAVAHAIVAMPVPVISGVGHETDFSIADFCADLRAPTPTAAAELAARGQADLAAELAVLSQRMQSVAQQRLQLAQQRTDHLVQRLADQCNWTLQAQRQRLREAAQSLGRPSQRIAQAQLHLTRLAQGLGHAAPTEAKRTAGALAQVAQQLHQAAPRMLLQHKQSLALLAGRLQALAPQQVLQRGYAWVADEAGRPLVSVQQVQPQQVLQAQLRDGTVQAQVLAVHPIAPQDRP
jgi:exodeoxyribonuclease VII large subunit